MGLDSAAGQPEVEAGEPAGRTLVWAAVWAAVVDFEGHHPAFGWGGDGGGWAGGRRRPGWSSQASPPGHPWASSLYSPQLSTGCQQKSISGI